MTITREASLRHRQYGTRLGGSPTRPSQLEPAVTLPVVLDVIETLLKASEHPDITKVERYGTSNQPWGPTEKTSTSPGITGVKVTHQSTSTASLWGAVWPGEQPAQLPEVLPVPRRNRAPRLVILVTQLLDVARPPQFKAWRAVTLPDLGRDETQAGLPFGLSIVLADGSRMLLRASATGVRTGEDPAEDPFPDYVIPEGVKDVPSWKQYSEDEPWPHSKCSTCGARVAAEVGDECPPHQGPGGALCPGSGELTKEL